MSPTSRLRAGVYERRPAGNGWPEPPVPQQSEVATALSRLESILEPSPIVEAPCLSSLLDRQVFLKLESESPVGSFKHRGALIAVQAIARQTSTRTVITASTGNHGQGVAYAAARAGLRSVVYAPDTAVETKIAAMRALGATVAIHGSNLAEAQDAAQRQTGPGVVYLEDGESPDLMSGAASVVSELIATPVNIDTVLVPTGGGNLISGSLLARAHTNSDLNIVGVQSTAASAATMSWLASEMVQAECQTFAGGLATTRPGQLALEVMVSYLETMVLVDDSDIYTAIGMLNSCEALQVEGAAAAPIAALRRFGDSIPGERVAAIVTGRWFSDEELITGMTMYRQTQ